MKYHIHVSSIVDTIQPGWKQTNIVLEKDDKSQHDKMFTKTYTSNSTSIDVDIANIICKYWNTYPSNTRFKIELLNHPNFVNSYNNKIYREVHMKLSIKKSSFYKVKEILLSKSVSLGFALSNNPKEVTNEIVTQFLNIRFLKGDYITSNINIKNIEDFIKTIEDVEYREKKDELSIFDTNFTLDSWWAH